MSQEITATTAAAINGNALSAAVELASAYVKANPGVMSADQALAFVRECYAQIAAVQTGAPVAAVADAVADEAFPGAPPPRPERPFVPVEQSVAADGSHIICLEDGARLKMLKRYLKRFNLTPEAYRERWGLPKDYPMTAPAYSAQKAGEAKAVGLGTALNKQGFNVGQLELAPAA